MNKSAGFMSTDTSGVKTVAKKLFSRKTLFIASAVLVIGAILAALAYFILMVSVFSALGAESPEKKQSAQAVHKSYQTLTVPSQFILEESKEACLAALDGCVGRMEYTYIYPKSLPKSNAIGQMRSSFEKQGFTFTSGEQGKGASLSLYIKQPFEATDTEGNPRIEVSAHLVKDQP